MNNNIGFDTLNAIDLFSDYQFNKDELIFHIPHSSTSVPDTTGIVSMDDFQSEINLFTDHHTDNIFNVNNTTKLICDFSRLFCDVERLEDHQEPMYNYGRGFFYTHSDNGILIRNTDIKNMVYENYYKPYHEKLTSLTEDKLNLFNRAIIIDCHSFSNQPSNTDLDKSPNRPNICLGVDQYHTPTYILSKCYKYFDDLGLSVKINSPYSGTIIPLKYYQKNKNVMGIMIEINKKLYEHHILDLNKIINNLFNNY